MIPPETKRDPCAGAQTDFRWLVENCADILCSVGLDHQIRYISASCFEILGWAQTEMIGEDLRRFILPEDLSALEDLEVGKPPEGTAYTHARLRLLRKDHTSVWISTNARCVLDSGSDEPRQYVLCMRDITGRTALEEKLSALAMTDTLTGLWNRRAFDQALWRECKRSSRKESHLSLLLLDLDHFKPLNDQYGHPLGDECLAAVAATITDTVRATDIVCRWGGDEIAVILPATDRAGALSVAEKLRSAIEVLCFRSDKDTGGCVSVTASIGVATAPTEFGGLTTGPRDLFQAADDALYQAKHLGHNRVIAAPTVPAGVARTLETVSSMIEVGDSEPGHKTVSSHLDDGLVRNGPPSGIDGP